MQLDTSQITTGHSPCAVCECRYTIDSLVELRLGPPLTAFTPVPLCPKHWLEAEGAIKDWAKIKSPPCVVNVQAVGAGISPGRIG